MPKILFFTAGQQPTPTEQTAIDAAKAVNVEPYEVFVRSGVANPNYGAGPEITDFVMGTPPDGLYTGVPVFDPENVPGALDSNQVAVTSGQAYTITAGENSGGTVTFTVVDGAITAVTGNTTP